MIGWLVGSSVRLRALVLGLAAVIIASGIVQLRRMPVDALPEFAPTTVQIQTDALGLSADEVEQLITVPMEQDLLNGVPWLRDIRSHSMPGVSSIEMVFDPGTDVLKARQAVQERLSQAHALPAVGTPPIMIQPLSSSDRVMMIGLTSREVSAIQMSVLARWKIRPKLMGLPGIANVAIWGQRDRQLQVQVDPNRLRRVGVTLDQVLKATGNSLWVSPLTFVEASTPGTGGFIDTPNQRLSIQHVLPITTAKSLSAVTMTGAHGRILRLGDVARVTENHQPLIGDARVNGGPGLVMVVEKFPEANTREVTNEVENALAAMAPGLRGIHIDTHVYRPATYLGDALRNLGRAALVSVLLILLLLGLLLRSWRAALVAAITIPLALLVATYVLYLTGATFNVMVAVGLAAALGIVVDDMLGSLDAIRRGVHPRPTEDAGQERMGFIAAFSASRLPLVYATAATALATVPLLFIPGIAGAFNRAAIAAFLLAALSSTIVALTVTPALGILLLGSSGASRDSLLTRWIDRSVERRGGHWLREPITAYGWLAALAAAGLLLILIVPGGLLVKRGAVLPTPQDRNLLVHWDAAVGTSLTEMDRITTAASMALRAVPGVAKVDAHVGRAVTSDQIVDVNAGELWISIAPTASVTHTMARIRAVLNKYPGLRHSVESYAADRLRSAQVGTRAPLAVRVYGNDFAVLTASARRMQHMLTTVPGVVAPHVALPRYQPTMDVRVNLAAAKRYGITPGDVRRETATLVAGILVGNMYQDQKVFDVVVWGTPAVRHNPATLRDVVIDTPAGGHVRLGDVATVQIRPGPADIKHDSVLRSVDVTADVHGRSLGAVLDDVRGRISAMPMPLDYHAEVVSDVAAKRSDYLRVWAAGLAVLIGVLLLLQAALESWRFAALAAVTTPLAGVGCLLVAPLVGGVRTVAAGAAIFMVLAIYLRSVTALLRHYQRLEQASDVAFGPDLVLRGTRDRAGPVVVTALTTAVALLPFLVLGRLAGTEVLFAMTAVAFGGLVTSTVLVLAVVPPLYLRLHPHAPVPRQAPSSTEPAAVS